MHRRHFLMKSAAAAGLALGSARRSAEQNVSPVFATASELAQWIQTGVISAADVLEAHLKHINQYNPPLNAIVTLDADRARGRAKEADAALARGERWGVSAWRPNHCEGCSGNGRPAHHLGFPSPVKQRSSD